MGYAHIIAVVAALAAGAVGSAVVINKKQKKEINSRILDTEKEIYEMIQDISLFFSNTGYYDSKFRFAEIKSHDDINVSFDDYDIYSKKLSEYENGIEEIKKGVSNYIEQFYYIRSNDNFWESLDYPHKLMFRDFVIFTDAIHNIFYSNCCCDYTYEMLEQRIKSITSVLEQYSNNTSKN